MLLDRAALLYVREGFQEKLLSFIKPTIADYYDNQQCPLALRAAASLSARHQFDLELKRITIEKAFKCLLLKLLKIPNMAHVAPCTSLQIFPSVFTKFDIGLLGSWFSRMRRDLRRG